MRKAYPSMCLVAVVAAFAASLTACTSSEQDVRPSAVNTEQPISQQTAATDERQRAKVHTELGSLYLQDGRLSVALEEGRIALSADSNYAPAYNLLGLTHMFLGDNKQAEENLRHALSLAPKDPEINNNFGWFLCQTGRETQSFSYFEMAMRSTLYQTPTKPYTNTGICKLRLKDYKSAEENLNIALRYDGANSQALYWLAEVFYQTGRYEGARQRIAELNKMIEPTPEATWLALKIDRKLGDREDELRNATQLRRKFASSPEYQKLQQGQYE